MSKYTAWVGRDNKIGFILQSGNPLTNLSVEQMAAITKYGFTYKGEEYNSITHASQCSKSDALALIQFQPGLMLLEDDGVTESELQFSGSDSKCELILYSATNTNGQIWGDQFELTMKRD